MCWTLQLPGAALFELAVDLNKMRIIYELFKIAIGVIIGAGLVVFLNLNLHIFDGTQIAAPTLTYSDLAAVNLTVATVVLGGVALIVAVAAVFGFQIIRSEAVTNAENRVRMELPVMLKKELKRMESDGRLIGVLDRAIYYGGESEDEGGESAFD